MKEKKQRKNRGKKTFDLIQAHKIFKEKRTRKKVGNTRTRNSRSKNENFKEKKTRKKKNQ